MQTLIMRSRFALAAWLALACGAGALGQEPRRVDLFKAVKAPASDPAATEPWFVRSRAVELNLGALVPFAQGKGEVVGGATIQLFDDVQVGLVPQYFDRPDLGGYTWAGQLDDHELSSFVLSVYQGVMVAEFRTVTGGTYQVRYAGAGVHFVRQIDPSKEGHCGGGIPPGAGGPAANQPLTSPGDVKGQPGVQPDDEPVGGVAGGDKSTSTIDLLVVYTLAAKNSQGGQAGMFSTINAAVADTNARFANSAIDHRVRLVGRQEVSYTETGDPSTDLWRLAYHLDGYMDDVHQLRTNVGADLVSLFVNNFAGNVLGVGYKPGTLAELTASTGFTAVEAGAAAGATLAHELGHNFGCHHYPDDVDNGHRAGDDPVVYPYAFGYRFYSFPWWYRTTMAYDAFPGYVRIAHFSNPNVVWGAWSVPTGTSGMDNAHVIINTGPTVAGYKPTVLPLGTWVDVNYSGPQYGTWAEPYSDPIGGWSHVPAGGTLIFKPGSIDMTAVLSKPMTMMAYGGSITLGQ